MEDKTGLYIVAIVGIVAVVALIVMMSPQKTKSMAAIQESSEGNVLIQDNPDGTTLLIDNSEAKDMAGQVTGECYTSTAAQRQECGRTGQCWVYPPCEAWKGHCATCLTP